MPGRVHIFTASTDLTSGIAFFMASSTPFFRVILLNGHEPPCSRASYLLMRSGRIYLNTRSSPRRSMFAKGAGLIKINISLFLPAYIVIAELLYI
jgi:hypothetical protein